MSKIITALFVICSIAYAMDVDPNQTPQTTDNENQGYTQVSSECKKFCSVTDIGGYRFTIEALGTVQECETGSSPTCTLQVCSASCDPEPS